MNTQAGDPWWAFAWRTDASDLAARSFHFGISTFEELASIARRLTLRQSFSTSSTSSGSVAMSSSWSNCSYWSAIGFQRSRSLTALRRRVAHRDPVATTAEIAATHPTMAAIQAHSGPRICGTNEATIVRAAESTRAAVSRSMSRAAYASATRTWNSASHLEERIAWRRFWRFTMAIFI